MYTFIENIKKDEYENFVLNHKIKSHFMQSYYFGEISKSKGFIPHYVGMKKDDKLVACALLLQKKLFKKTSYFYSPRGFVLDFNDEKLLTEFTKYVKNYTKKFNSFFTAIDPDIKLQNLDIDGNVIEGENNFKLIETLKKIGYKHLGFNKNFENREPRYTFRLSLEPNIDDIHKNMHATTRKILNKGNQYNLNAYIGNENDLEDFYFTMKETAIREGITPFPFEYYKNFYNTFNKNNMSDLYIVKVNINDLINIYNKKIDDINNDIKNACNLINKNKSKNLLNDYNNQLEKLEKELELIKKIEEKELVLSSIITVKYGDKVWTVHGGNSNKLRELNANYLLYDLIICDAKKEGFKLIDFFGTTGNDNDNNKIHGIHLFKKRLGGEYMEFIGEFHLITNKFMYFIYTKIVPKCRKLMKKIKRNS